MYSRIEAATSSQEWNEMNKWCATEKHKIEIFCYDAR